MTILCWFIPTFTLLRILGSVYEVIRKQVQVIDAKIILHFVFLHNICASSVLASKTNLFLFSILGLMRKWGLNVGERDSGLSSFLGLRMLKACHTFSTFFFLCTGWDPLIAWQGWSLVYTRGFWCSNTFRRSKRLAPFIRPINSLIEWMLHDRHYSRHWKKQHQTQTKPPLSKRPPSSAGRQKMHNYASEYISGLHKF